MRIFLPLPNSLAVRAALTVALTTAVGVAGSAPVLVGLPTYSVVGIIDDDRGSESPPYLNSLIDTSWSSQGGAAASLFQIRPNQEIATVVGGEATAGALKSLAIATGPLGFPQTQMPFVHANSRSETTRFWQFSGPGQSTTGFSPLILGFDGSIRGVSTHFLLQNASSRLSFGLDLIDTNNNLLGNIFTVGAELTYTPLAPDLWTLSTSALGLAAGTGWEASFTRRPPQSVLDLNHIHDFLYTSNMTSSYPIPTNQVVGLRWFLETEGLFEGVEVFSAIVGADASSTATFDSAVGPANLGPGASAVEVFSSPDAPVPEPSSWALLVGGLLCLRGACRRPGLVPDGRGPVLLDHRAAGLASSG